MNQICDLFGGTIWAARWGLAWISVVAITTIATYAVTVVAVSSAPAVSEVSAADTVAYEESRGDLRGSCASLFGSYDYWLIEKDRTGPCGLGNAAQAATSARRWVGDGLSVRAKR